MQLIQQKVSLRCTKYCLKNFTTFCLLVWKHLFDIICLICFSSQDGRTDPNLDDVGLTFSHMHVRLNELETYLKEVEPIPFAHPLPSFPIPKRNNLQIPQPGSRDCRERLEYIPEHMPPLGDIAGGRYTLTSKGHALILHKGNRGNCTWGRFYKTIKIIARQIVSITIVICIVTSNFT